MVGTSRLMMMFDAKDLSLKQWTVTDPQGFDTTVAVYNLDTAKKPDPNLFVINYASDNPAASAISNLSVSGRKAIGELARRDIYISGDLLNADLIS